MPSPNGIGETGSEDGRTGEARIGSSRRRRVLARRRPLAGSQGDWVALADDRIATVTIDGERATFAWTDLPVGGRATLSSDRQSVWVEVPDDAARAQDPDGTYAADLYEWDEDRLVALGSVTDVPLLNASRHGDGLLRLVPVEDRVRVEVQGPTG